MIYKQIDDKEFFELQNLWYTYQKVIGSKANNFSIIKSLLDLLLEYNSKAIGMYDKDTLVGFCIYYEISDSTTVANEIFILPKYKIYILKFLKYVESTMNTNRWIATPVTLMGKRLLENYTDYKRGSYYIKEIKWVE
jgi:hypothetical protein